MSENQSPLLVASFMAFTPNNSGLALSSSDSNVYPQTPGMWLSLKEMYLSAPQNWRPELRTPGLMAQTPWLGLASRSERGATHHSAARSLNGPPGEGPGPRGAQTFPVKCGGDLL